MGMFFLVGGWLIVAVVAIAFSCSYYHYNKKLERVKKNNTKKLYSPYRILIINQSKRKIEDLKTKAGILVFVGCIMGIVGTKLIEK